MTRSGSAIIRVQHQGDAALTAFRMFPHPSNTRQGTCEQRHEQRQRSNGHPPTGVASSAAPPPSASARRSRRTSARPASSAPRTVPPGGDGTAAAGVDAVNPFGIADSSTVDAVIFDGGYGIDYVAVRRRHLRPDPRGLDRRGLAVDADRHRAAAPLRRRQPARPHRQLRCPGDRLQHDPRPARGPHRRHRRPQPRGRHDPRHAVRRRARAGHVRRQAGRDQLRPHGVRGVVLGEPVRGERLDAADDVGRGLELGAAAEEQDKYLFCWGKEAATYYRTMCHRVGDQGGRRRGPPGNREPRGGRWSLPAVQAVFTGAEGDHRRRLHAAGRRRHAVHPGAGAVEPRPGRAHVPVGLVDRERDEGADRRELRR